MSRAVAMPVRLIDPNPFIERANTVSFRADPYGSNGRIAKAPGSAEGVEPGLRRDDIDSVP